jgi:hypothetical protein
MMSANVVTEMFKKTYEELITPLKPKGTGRHTYCSVRRTYGFDVSPANTVTVGAWKGAHKGKSGPIVFVHTDRHAVVILVDGKELKIPMANIGVLNGKGEWVEDVPFDVTGRRLKVGDFVVFPETSGTRTYTLGFGHIKGFTASGNSTVEVKAKDGRAVPDTRYGPLTTTLYSYDRVLKLPFEEDDAVAWILNGFNRLEI